MIRKFLISPILRSSGREPLRRKTQARGMLAVSGGRGVIFLRGVSEHESTPIKQSILKNIQPVLADSNLKTHRLLWAVEDIYSGWSLCINHRKWPSKVDDHQKMLILCSRYMNINLHKEDDISGFLIQNPQTLQISNMAPSASHTPAEIRRIRFILPLIKAKKQS